MNAESITFTSFALIIIAILMIVLFACHFLGPQSTMWLRSNKEEKIGLSKSKLFHANGYMHPLYLQIHSGSEFLLSTSGSFKRFDTPHDKDDHRDDMDHLSQHTTTPLWNLPQTDSDIPPQPLRPAPAPSPNSSGYNKTVTFSFTNEISSNGTSDSHDESDSGSNNKNHYVNSVKEATNPQPIEMPPPPRICSSSSVTLSTVAIPRPMAKRQISLQNGQHSSNTNPFLGTSIENVQSTQAAMLQPQDKELAHNDSSSAEQLSNDSQKKSVFVGNGQMRNTSVNPFKSESNRLVQSSNDLREKLNGNFYNGRKDYIPHRATLQTEESETDLKRLSSKFAKSSLNKITNPTNPFMSITRHVKGPHLLQKTISEDFLFRKLNRNHLNGAESGNVNSVMRNCGLDRRNSSQFSIDSYGSGSIDGVNLEHAISCDSVNSDISYFLTDLDQPYTQITGYLHVGLHCNKELMTADGSQLTVKVLEAKELLCPFNVEHLDTFVRIAFVPDHAGTMQTKTVYNSATPSYNEQFNFWMKNEFDKHSLWFHLYYNGEAHTLIGEAEMEIDEIPRTITTWIPLSDSRKINAMNGELMFSLSYLPTAERLTIVVVKARNIPIEVSTGDKSNDAPTKKVRNVFVKVYLIDNDKKVLKKKTSMKRKDRSPIFNESMIFNVPPQSLTTVKIRFTIFGVMEDDTIAPLGHVIAGSYATGKGLRHWHQMLTSLRKPVVMWHVLKRGVNQPVFTGGAEAVVAALQSSSALRAKRNSII